MSISLIQKQKIVGLSQKGIKLSTLKGFLVNMGRENKYSLHIKSSDELPLQKHFLYIVFL